MKKILLFGFSLCGFLLISNNSILSEVRIETNKQSSSYTPITESQTGNPSNVKPQNKGFKLWGIGSPPQRTNPQTQNQGSRLQGIGSPPQRTNPQQKNTTSQTSPRNSQPQSMNSQFPPANSQNANTGANLCNGGKLSSLSNYKGSESKYKSVSSGEYVYYAGYQQITRDDQDAFAIKADKNGNVCWNKRLTGANGKSGPDEKCSNLAISKEDGKGFIYLVCRTDGGSYTGFSLPSSPAPFQKSYGNGGGPAASVILKLNEDNGNTVAGTYVRGTLKSGKTNTINTKEVSVNSERAEITGETAWGAPTTNSTKRCKGGTYKAHLSLNLSNLLSVVCGGGEESL